MMSKIKITAKQFSMGLYFKSVYSRGCIMWYVVANKQCFTQVSCHDVELWSCDQSEG